MKLSGWGKYPKIDSKISSPNDVEELIKLVKKGNAIARGNGRAYGDSAISLENTIHMKKFNKIISFESSAKRLYLKPNFCANLFCLSTVSGLTPITS